MLALALTTVLVAAAPQDVLQLAPCNGQGGEYEAVLDGNLLLHKEFLDPALTAEENARAAVLHQVRYVWGWLRTNPEAHRTMQAALSAEPATIEAIKLSDATYGQDLALPWVQKPPHLVIEDPYTLRAITKGATTSKDPAVRVDYRVRFKLALCSPPRDVDSTLVVPLPRDPWLMHWHVPQALHRPLRYFESRAVTNPCSDDDYADLPHPIYHWYDWQPDRHGPDDDGKDFDCRSLLHDGVDFVQHILKLHRVSQAGGDFGDLATAWAAHKGPLKATLLFGVQQHGWKDLDMAPWKALLAGGAPLKDRVRATQKSPRPKERGMERMLDTLAGLPSVVDVKSHQSSVEGDYLRVDVQATLRRSSRPVELQFFYGLTDVFGPTPPSHWEILRRAVTQDHILTYVGHSGIGENVKLANIQKHLKLEPAAFSAQVAKAPYQLVAFLSCYSYMYFGQDMLEAGASGRQFLFTATPYAFGDQGNLAVLDLADQVLAGGTTQVGVPKQLNSGDFLLFKARRPLGK